MLASRTRNVASLWLIVMLAITACADDDDPDDTTANDEPGEPLPEPDDEPADAPEPVEALGDDTWSTLAEAPLEVTEVGAAALDGELWTAGGITADADITTAVQIYDPSVNEWRSGPDLPEPVHHAPIVAMDSQLVVVGGYRTIGFDPVADVLVLDEETGGWVEGPSLPEPRGAGAAAWDGERLVFGGGIGEDGLADEIWVLDDLDNGAWSHVASLSIARDHLAATSDGEGTVWFLAGREASLEANLGTVDQLITDELVQIGDLPTPRGGVAAFFSEQHGACLAGGEQPQSTFAEVECILSDGTVTALPELSIPRHGLGAAVIGGVAYVALGGPDPMLAVSGTVEALRIDR